MTGSGQSHNFLDDKTNTGKGIVIMDRNTTKYKVKQYIIFAGISTVLFAAVVIIPFIYGLYLTFTSWDGISKDKQFVGFANYIATFKDIAYWQALGRTVIYSVISVVLVNVVAFSNEGFHVPTVVVVAVALVAFVSAFDVSSS